MTAAFQNILNQVERLDSEERNVLLSCLIHGLEKQDISNVDNEWKMEVENRIASSNNGQTEMMSWDQSIHEARQKAHRQS
jgi:hypothetical protein